MQMHNPKSRDHQLMNAAAYQTHIAWPEVVPFYPEMLNFAHIAVNEEENDDGIKNEAEEAKKDLDYMSLD